jgi:hypothetical protein
VGLKRYLRSVESYYLINFIIEFVVILIVSLKSFFGNMRHQAVMN